MSNSSSWFSSVPVQQAFNWNFSQTTPMQVTQTNPNHNYQEISKNFMESFISSNNLGINYIGHHYTLDARISIVVHQGFGNHMYELVGYTNLKLKMAELNINTIKYSNIFYTPQLLGKNSIVITTFGKAEINNNQHNIMATYIVRMTNGMPKITNHILDIFV
ncbi:MAG: putative ORFan [Satyrvirus sp.]|uniref:Putative ORFan n=1 Tax=Satyrvirus sp. TaxID=2487771 RepID=A0A3G5AFN4_9VIRU|nr:MAG: putative ORFan [Satyrvirus sp.]